jgi:hypothetical protein
MLGKNEKKENEKSQKSLAKITKETKEIINNDPIKKVNYEETEKQTDA